MALTLDTIQELAPDQKSLKAAGKLLQPAKWPLAAVSQERGLAWGECQGSGSTPYRAVLDLNDHGYRCTCPSRKFPCKHVLALGWRVAETGLPDGTPPEWVEEWLTRRRGRRAGAIPGRASAPSAPKDLAAAVTPEAEPPAEEVAARAERAAKATRRRVERRERAMLAGMDELQTWVADVLGEGLGQFEEQAVDRCRSAAARLVDAQCGGLARWVDTLPAGMFDQPGAHRARWLMQELGLIILAVEAYRRLDRLSPALQHDVRRLVGWNQRRQDLLEDPDALRVSGTWTVLGVHSEAQVDNLIRHETWLRHHSSSQWAALVDHMPLSGRTGAPFHVGEVLEAELVYYPSAVPLRALLGQRSPDAPHAPARGALQHGITSISAAWSEAQALRARLPWLPSVPLVLDQVQIARRGRRFVVTQPARPGTFLPVSSEADAALLALGATGPATIAGLLREAAFQPLAAWSTCGWWSA